MSKKELSFVPPDGLFTLMEYRVTKPLGSNIGSSTAPVALKPGISLTEDGGNVYRGIVIAVAVFADWEYSGAFEISASSKNRTLENVAISIFLGRGSGSVTATIWLGNSISGFGQGGVRPGKGRSKEGSWDFNPRTHVGIPHVTIASE